MQLNSALRFLVNNLCYVAVVCDSQKSDTSELVIFTLFLTAGFLEMLQKFPLKKKFFLKKERTESFLDKNLQLRQTL